MQELHIQANLTPPQAILLERLRQVLQAQSPEGYRPSNSMIFGMLLEHMPIEEMWDQLFGPTPLFDSKPEPETEEVQ